MNELIIAFVVFLIAVFLMAVGVLLANKPLRGSCGGLGTLRKLFGLGPCASCDDDPEEHADRCSRARQVRDQRKQDPMEV